MGYVVRPLGPWISATRTRRDSPFSAAWSNTVQLLEREIRLLGAPKRPWVLQIDVTERWIRQDGELYARAAPASPAVRVAFESRHGPLTYGSDRFVRWQDNVRAVALSLEALRKVDRYGVAGRGEQYRGWLAIDAQPAQFTVERAAEFIAAWSGLPNLTGAGLLDSGPDGIRAAYRRAARRVHPDAGGDHDSMSRLNAARDLLTTGWPL